MKSKTRKIVISAMLAALVCVGTMIIKIPLPGSGYIHLGDGVVLLAAGMLSPLYGFLVAAVGSALADLLSGFVIYAPATFVIKGCMASVAYFIFARLKDKLGHKGLPARLIGSAAAEVIMVGGYFIFEWVLYDLALALANIPMNGIQGAAGIVIGVVLIEIFERSHLFDK